MKLIYFWLFLHNGTTLKSSYVVATSVTVAVRSTQPSLLLATCARLSWSHSSFESTLNSPIASYRIVSTLHLPQWQARLWVRRCVSVWTWPSRHSSSAWYHAQRTGRDRSTRPCFAGRSRVEAPYRYQASVTYHAMSSRLRTCSIYCSEARIPLRLKTQTARTNRSRK